MLSDEIGGTGRSLRSHFIKGVLGSGGLGAVSSGLSLLIAVVLARSLGVDGYGKYAFALAVVTFVSIPVQIGLPALLVREIASSNTHENWSMMRGMRRRAVQIASISVIIGVIVLVMLALFPVFTTSTYDATTYVLAILLLPLWVAFALQKSMLNGLRNILQAAWPGAVLQPALFLLLLLAAALGAGSLSPPLAIAANIAATAAALLAISCLLRLYWPRQAVQAEPKYHTKQWIRSLLPFTLIAGINIISQKTDILMLGILQGPEDVGIYNVALQGSLLISFSLTAFNAVLVPNITRLYAQGEHQQMQRLLTISTAITSVIAGLTAVILITTGRWILQWVFGESFEGAYLPLCILIVGQLVNALFGSVGYFLSMTGHEKETLRALGISTVVNVVLNVILIPHYGASGAAVATAVSVMIWNTILGFRLFRCLGLVPGPLPRRRTAST